MLARKGLSGARERLRIKTSAWGVTARPGLATRSSARRCSNTGYVRGAGSTHAYRRRWVTVRKDLPAVDVAAAGGWKNVGVVKDVYTQADEHTTLGVVLHEGTLREA